MISFDKCGSILDDIADSLPLDLYRELNGGILLREERKIHPLAKNNDLFILGEYVRDNLGKSIKIYYGSLMAVFYNKTEDEMKEELRKVLLHELRHHNEYLAGIDDLIYYDNERINEYLNK